MALKFLILACLFTYHNSFASVDLSCIYDSNAEYEVLGRIYRCRLSYNPNIVKEESAAINAISGEHNSTKSGSDVAGFVAEGQNIHYFPRNLETFFNNLKLIKIYQCQLKEIHQENLKSFPKLVFLYLSYNFIEILEKDLFAFNPELELIAFTNNKIIHMDSKIFDHLNKLSYFWFSGVPCVNKEATNSKDKSRVLKTLAKFKCVSSDFLSLEEKLKVFQNEANTLTIEDLQEKLDQFEVMLKLSKFPNILKFRPFSNSIQSFKSLISGNLPLDSRKPSSISETCRSDQTLASDMKFSNLSDNLKVLITDNLMNIQTKFDDLKTSQCGAKDIFTDLLTSQTTLYELKSSQNEAKSSIHSLSSKTSTIISSQESLKSSQTQMTSSINSLQANLNNLKDITKQSQDDIKTSLSDIEATLSDTIVFQNDVKSSLNKLKTTQNEIKISLNEVWASKSENTDDKLENVGGKFGDLEEFKAIISEKLEKMEKELSNTRHKISINFDEKIKGIENRLMKKFEEVLEEKLRKILEAN